MQTVQEALVKWADIKNLTAHWIESLDPKWRTGETIYTQLNKILLGIVEDLQELNAANPAMEYLVLKVKELEAWKQSAIATTPDMQAIGKEMDLKLGETVHDKILPFIKNLKQELEFYRQHV